MPDPPDSRDDRVEIDTSATVTDGSLAAGGNESTLPPRHTGEIPGAGSASIAVPGQPRYQRRATLGSGAMGEVGLYEDKWIGREVALKTLLPRASGERARFVQEMRVQGQLEHPAVVPVHDCGTDAGGQPFFTMRRVRGETLEQVIAGLAQGDPAFTERFSRRKLLTAFASVCLAVHYAHTRGVIHRDLKPANIMLGEFGEVYLLDWGVAKVSEAADLTWTREADPEATRPGTVVGTPSYMSPEQLGGRSDTADASSDIYSLGMILYELLALRQPHEGLTYFLIVEKVLEGFDRRPSSVRADVAPELDAICERALAASRAERFHSAKEVAEAIERYLDGDRDLQRRRVQAAEQARRAAELCERARAAQARGEDGQSERADAMRAVTRALTLDPDGTDAGRTLALLLAEVPERMPKEVESEMADAARRGRQEAARLAFFAFISTAVVLPFVPLVGVRSWPAFLAGCGLLAVTLTYTAWGYRRIAVGPRHSLALAVLNGVIIAMVSAWLGPFVLVPTIASVTTLLFISQLSKEERPWFVLINVAAALLPLGLELAGVLPPSFSFEHGRLVLLPRAVELPEWPTVALLVYTTIGYIIVPAFFLARLRDALTSAERKLFLHAWHLRRLLS